MSGPVWAVLPVKPLRGALRRLAAALEAPVRRELQVAMLTDVLGALAGARGLAGVLVVTSDPDAAALAERLAGARVVPDHDPPRGMNAAVARGLAAVAGEGAAGALVVTADLPLARPADIDAILAHPVGPGPSAVLVPSAAGTGTNAMLLRPPSALRPRLGPDSFARHSAQARERDVAVESAWRVARLALDIDTPPDLAALMAGGGSARRWRPARASRWGCCCRPGARSEDLAAVGPARGRAGGRPRRDARRAGARRGGGAGRHPDRRPQGGEQGRGPDRHPGPTCAPARPPGRSRRRPAKGPELCELILSESARIVRRRGATLICETHHGFVCANAGIDSSNAP